MDTVGSGHYWLQTHRFVDTVGSGHSDLLKQWADPPSQPLLLSLSQLVKASTAYGMEISAEKTKLMTNNTSGINTEIKVNGQKLEIVTSFKYLGLVINDEGSKPEFLSRIAQATAALTRLKPVWNDGSISVSSKIQLMGSLVTSIFLYACELRTLTAELQRKIQAFK